DVGDEHVVTAPPQFAREVGELPLGAAAGEGGDEVEDPHRISTSALPVATTLMATASARRPMASGVMSSTLPRSSTPGASGRASAFSISPRMVAICGATDQRAPSARFLRSA